MKLLVGHTIKKMLIVVLLVVSHGTSYSQPYKLKVVSYNIWNGYEWGKDSLRRSKLIGWMDARKPDIVALQELCAYTEEKLAKDAGAWGHEHSVLLKKTGYSVGITSRYPIIVKEKILEGMHHGALHCEIKGVEVFVIHLSPFSWKKRDEEADILLSRIKKRQLLQHDKDIIVCGDFNALSPVDYDWYNGNASLLEKRRESEKKHEHIENLRNGMLCFSTISKFMGAGLYDVCARYVNEGSDRRTSPTLVFAKNKEDEERLRKNSVRIDFILASYSLAEKCTNAAILNKNETSRLSDHYPVECLFVLNKKNENRE
ncbi:MAG: endonuclease/exonuclease/phosphatase family protein [Cytophagales bacterium]|nr:endonuclease/exonuclease/phosphatase family protein [Cytophagales bacterium]